MHAQPLITENVPLPERFKRIGVLLSVAFLGLGLGLLSMGVRPLPRDLGLLFRYGLKKPPRGISVLRYEGQTVQTEPGKFRLRVFGELYNYSKDVRKPPTLLLKVFSPENEFLVQKSSPCCESGLKPWSGSPFTLEADLPSAAVGRYEVTAEK